MAHDFNKLLGVVSNSAHLMRRQTAALPEAQAQRCEVALSDIAMPGAMDGVMPARVLRRRWPLLPMVLISGYGTRTPPAGEFLVLHKPCSQAELVAALRQAMAAALRWRAHGVPCTQQAAAQRGRRLSEFPIIGKTPHEQRRHHRHPE